MSATPASRFSTSSGTSSAEGAGAVAARGARYWGSMASGAIAFPGAESIFSSPCGAISELPSRPPRAQGARSRRPDPGGASKSLPGAKGEVEAGPPAPPLTPALRRAWTSLSRPAFQRRARARFLRGLELPKPPKTPSISFTFGGRGGGLRDGKSKPHYLLLLYRNGRSVYGTENRNLILAVTLLYRYGTRAIQYKISFRFDPPL